MPNAQLVLELLEEALGSGRSPEDVCAESPELLDEVRQRWIRCRQLNALIDDLFPSFGRDDQHLPQTATQALPPIPGYQVEAVLGHGGVGIVYKAQHLQLRRTVALKMLLSGVYASASERARFSREAESVAALRHPNVVQIHDVGEFDGRPFFTMEWLEGGSLAERLAGVPIAPTEAAAITVLLAGAVECAHRGGIIHRDLKPANVLLAPDGTPKISDFGLALREGDGERALTLSGVRVGTPSYMAPEQASGRRGAVGPATDIYALGAILYEMLTGRPPFRAESAAETERQLLSEEVVRPSYLNARVPRDVETICLTCLKKDTTHRYKTAAALADDLARWMRGEPILARRTGALTRVAKWMRRRPAHATLLVGGSLLTLTIAGAVFWSAAQRAVARRAIDTDLADVIDAERSAEWKRAARSLQRAQARLIAFPNPQQLASAKQREREMVFIQQLADVHRRPFSDIDVDSPDRARALREYRLAFENAGYGSVDMPPETVAEQIAQSPMRDAWVRGLDGWATQSIDAAERQWICAVARLVDPDPSGWRDQVRQPAKWKDRAELVRLARIAKASEQPALLQLSLAARISDAGGNSIPYLRRIQRAYPNDYWANEMLAIALAQRGPSEEAVAFARAAVALHPEMESAHCVLGGALGAVGKVDDEIDENRQALKLNPDFLPSHNNIAIALASKGQWDECTEHFERAKEIDPRRPNVDVQVGALMQVAGLLDQAKVRYERAVSTDPTNATARANLGMLLQQMGKHDEAAEQLRRSLELRPRYAFALRQLAEVRAAQGKFDEAQKLYGEALEAEPDDASAHAGTRAMMVRQGRIDEMRERWASALETTPKTHDACYGYAELCLFLGREDDYRRACDVLRMQFGSAKSPEIAQRVARAMLLVPRSEPELQELEKMCQTAMNARATVSPAIFSHFAFAQALLDYRRGNFDESIVRLKREAADASKPAPQLVLSMALAKTGRATEARTVFDEAVRSYDWSDRSAVDQDDWIIRVLRREAEAALAAR